jgi:hypothetical protein
MMVSLATLLLTLVALQACAAVLVAAGALLAKAILR